MVNPTELLIALVGQNPQMGGLVIHEDDDQKDLLWNVFHVRFKSKPSLELGHYVYRYVVGEEDDDDFPMATAKLCNEEGDTICLYHISQSEKLL